MPGCGCPKSAPWVGLPGPVAGQVSTYVFEGPYNSKGIVNPTPASNCASVCSSFTCSSGSSSVGMATCQSNVNRFTQWFVDDQWYMGVWASSRRYTSSTVITSVDVCACPKPEQYVRNTNDNGYNAQGYLITTLSGTPYLPAYPLASTVPASQCGSACAVNICSIYGASLLTSPTSTAYCATSINRISTFGTPFFTLENLCACPTLGMLMVAPTGLPGTMSSH